MLDDEAKTMKVGNIMKTYRVIIKDSNEFQTSENHDDVMNAIRTTAKFMRTYIADRIMHFAYESSERENALDFYASNKSKWKTAWSGTDDFSADKEALHQMQAFDEAVRKLKNDRLSDADIRQLGLSEEGSLLIKAFNLKAQK